MFSWYSIFIGAALKSTAVLGLAWLSALLLRKRSAAARHLVWTAAAAAVLALPFLTVWLPVLRIPAPAALLPVTTPVMFYATASAPRDAAVRQSAAHAGPGVSLQPAPPDWRTWLMLLWSAGTAAAFAQMLAACLAIWRVRHSAKPFPDRGLCGALSQELGIRHSVDVLETEAGTMPMTFGIPRSAVFMPSDAADWSEERRRVVLLHELGHVRRGDVATHLLARTALALYWWNPLAWKAWREFLKERERATDDLVLNAGARASEYASHLLEVARTMQSSPAIACAGVAMARRSQLESRLLAILDSGVSRKTSGPAAALVAALLAVGMVAPLAAVRTQSVDYGVELLKQGELEKKRGMSASAEDFYTKAVEVLGDRPEAAHALMYLGITAIGKKDFQKAIDHLERAERVDRAQAGPARMWMALAREREQRFDEAETLFRSSLTADSQSAAAAITLTLYARFLGQQGRAAEASDLDARALVVRKANEVTSKPTTTQGVYRVGGEVKPPVLLQRKEPAYSEEARIARLDGTVTIYVEIGLDGMTHNPQVLRGVGLGLDENALEAVSQWQFQPGTKDGQPVVVVANIEVTFRLL